MGRPLQTDPAFFEIEEIAVRVQLAGFWKLSHEVWNRFRMPYHQFMLIESGRFEFDCPQGHIRAKAGDLVIVRPAERAQYRLLEPGAWYQLCVTFRAPPRHRETPVLGELGPLPFHTPLGGAREDARRVFETICIELPQAGVAHRLRVAGAIYELLTILAGVIPAPAPQTRAQAQGGEWERARAQLCAPMNRPSIRELSREMGISTEHFIRRFRQRFGVSPKAYEMRVKLDAAVRVLRGAPERSIKAIAYDMGYGDPRNLSRAMQRHLGIKPQDLRLAGRKVVLAREGRGGGRGLFRMNQHIIPPDAPDDWLASYYGRKLAAQILKTGAWAFPERNK